MAEPKINVSRFCDIQGVNDIDREILVKKYKGVVATLPEWYDTVTKLGFELHPLKKFDAPASTDAKQK